MLLVLVLLGIGIDKNSRFFRKTISQLGSLDPENLLSNFTKYRYFREIQGDAKVTLPKRKSDISITIQANELIFLSMIEAYSSFISIMTSLGRPFVNYHY
jgi:hypothetical protein